MSASNPQGEQKFWENGLPAEALAKTTPDDIGVQKYWFNGLPEGFLFPPSGTYPGFGMIGPFPTHFQQ